MTPGCGALGSCNLFDSLREQPTRSLLIKEATTVGEVIPFPLHRAEPDLAHYRVEHEIGEESGITVRILARIAWPHDLLVTLAGTFEGGSTVAAYPAEEMHAATVAAHAVLAGLEAAEITWDLQRIAAATASGSLS